MNYVAERNSQFLSLTERLQAARKPVALIFDTPGELIEGVFGPSQHDQHCLTRHRHLWLAGKLDARQRALGCNYGR